MKWPDEPFRIGRDGGAGATRHQLRRALESGELRRMFTGVCVATRVPDDQTLRARAASLVLPAHAVVSDRSAAWLHGVDAFDPVALDIPPELEVVALDGGRCTSRRGALGGARDLAASDIEMMQGVRVTTAVRTAADIGCLRGRSGAFAGMSMLARAGGFGSSAVTAMLLRLAGRRGVIQLRELAPLIEPQCESPGECWALLPILDAGLPRPKPQHEFWLDGWGLVRLDFAYPHLKVCVEYFGEEFHDDEARQHDEARLWHLRSAGWIVIVVRKEDLRGAALDSWLVELRAELERARSRRVYARARR
jgi:hypothetical protein